METCGEKGLQVRAIRCYSSVIISALNPNLLQLLTNTSLWGIHTPNSSRNVQ